MYPNKNWYKKAQQETFEFLHSLPQSIQTQPEELKNHSDPSNFKEELDDVNDYNDLIKLLKDYRIQYEEIKFPQTAIIKVKINDDEYIIDDFEYPSLEEANSWIWVIANRGQVDDYIPSQDFSNTFWDDVTNGSAVYHATTEENWELIETRGLLASDKTRGVANRHTGSSVFTSENPDDIDSYGDVVLSIDLGSMKKDGYMPPVSREEPIEEAEQLKHLAHKIGLLDFEPDIEQGISPSTIVIFGNIPPKYLSVY